MPELAYRMHTEAIHHVIALAMKEAGLAFSNLQAVAATRGPGLEGALIVGTVAAKTLSNVLGIPYIGVNHLMGHLYAAFLTENPPEFPFLGLIVSGGHTMLVRVDGPSQIVRIGTTKDDAAGEAFDKVARTLGLPYPGGPAIEKAAKTGNPKAFHFPRAMKHQALDFSFSGIKTAVIHAVEGEKAAGRVLVVADVAASFQQAVIDILVIKTMRALDQFPTQHLVICGGVTANSALRSAFETAVQNHQVTLVFPPFAFCTDNAAMIGAAAYVQYQMEGPTAFDIPVSPNLGFPAEAVEVPA